MLATSKVWYTAKIYPPPPAILDSLENIKWKFLWPSGPELVHRETMVQSQDSGGQAVVDIKLKCQALLMSWLWRIIEGKERIANCFTLYYIGRQLGFNNNLRPNASLPNVFYKKVVTTYRKFRALSVSKHNCQTLYQAAVSSWLSLARPRCVDEWRPLLMSQVQWEQVWKASLHKLADPSMADFNGRVIHRVVPVFSRLRQWGMLVSEKCRRCGQRESLEHAVLECPSVRDLWSLVRLLSCRKGVETMILTSTTTPYC